MIPVLIDVAKDQTIFLDNDKEYTVGRQNCDILIENDKSISRTHAKIRVDSSGNNIILVDWKSTYGTFHNKKKMVPHVEITLKHKDSIRFGLGHSNYCFKSYKFLVATSLVGPEKKLTLKENLDKCNGVLVDKWHDKCTHLVLETFKATSKVLEALIEEKLIVTPEYFTDYVKSMEEKKPPPNINYYNKPPVVDFKLGSSFQYKYDKRRKTLFSNKVFVFLKTNSMKQIENIIKSCGGQSISWEETPQTAYDIKKSPFEYIMVTVPDDEENISFNAVIKELEKENKRHIPLSEIVLAIMHCSCEKDCNPNYDKVGVLLGSRTTPKKFGNVLVEETPDLLENIVEMKPETVVPPTVEDDWVTASEMEDMESKNGANKRAAEELNQDNKPKKMKLGKQSCSSKENKPITVFQRDKKTVNQTNPFKEIQVSQKRKASEEVECTESSKSNPFASIKPVSSKRNKANNLDNPFSQIQKISETSTQSTMTKHSSNLFADILKVSDNTSVLNVESKIENMSDNSKRNLSSALKIHNNVENKSLLNSKKHSIKKESFQMTSNKNSTWLSKQFSKMKVAVKEEDAELDEYLKAFENCVKIKPLIIYERPSAANFTITLVDGKEGVKNFKKFKKVQPLRPQVTIIGSHQLKIHGPGDLTGLEINAHNFDDDMQINPRNLNDLQAGPKPTRTRKVFTF